MIAVHALGGIPEVEAGDEPAELIAAAIADDDALELTDDDVIVVAHKLVSKAEGRTRRLGEIVAGPEAMQLAGELGKDPRLVEVILGETAEVRRAEHGVLISVTHHGFVCANAGVDASNAPGEDTVILLPVDPDGSARRLRAGIETRTGRRPGVVVTDSFGRAWRHGQVDVAIGCAGIVALDDWRGRTDREDRALHATAIAAADELAAAADLARTKDGGQPAVLVTGAGRHVTSEDGPGIAPLLREASADLFR